MKCFACDKTDWIEQGGYRECRGCRSVLLGEALTREILIEGHGLNLQELRQKSDDAIRKEKCPNCGATMHSIIVKHDAVDLCFGCGTLFLNENEIDRVTLGRLGDD